MTITTTATPPADLDADLLLLPLIEEPSDVMFDVLADTLSPGVHHAAKDFSGATGETLLLYPEETIADRVALLGLGAGSNLDAEALRRAAAGGADLALEREVDTVALLMPELDLDPNRTAQALVEGFVLGAYRFTDYKTDPDAGPGTLLVRTGDDGQGTAGAERGRILAEAACSARTLVNRSPNNKTATQFAAAMRESAEAHGYDAEVWYQDQIAEEGMGGLMAVNQGSFEPPTFTMLTWAPDDAVNEQPVVLAGKGIVFDTGGLSLKDTKDSMDFMKADMAGAAAVVGAFEALAELNVPLHVVGLVPATDNRPGNKAYVPGDVIRMHSGATVEVLNTDAEGRLILADALSYATRYEPELVIDLATLTGAAVVALGSDAAAVMTSETDGASERLYAIQRSGERTGERVHPLPMYEEYKKLLDSNVADLKNVGGREAGSVTAGKFLEHFVDYPWMHLDIAGTAFLKKAKPYRPEGGTGFGVRLLIDYLEHYIEARTA